MVTLGSTEAEARSRARQLEELASPEFRWQNALYTAGLDPDAFDPDAPLPAELWADRSAPSSRAEELYAAARARPGASLREIAQQVTGGAGQIHFVGTPEQLADHATAWQDAGAARRAAREKIVEAGHADFFDHSVVETILGSDLRAKSYAPGAWLGFNPDFVYRHRQ